MLYKKFRSVPAKTTKANPDWQKLIVTKGTIKQWVIFFDPEAANLLHIRIEYRGLQIIPFSGSEWLTGFFTDTPMMDNIKIGTPPYVLDIYAYNEDDSYPHEYYIHPIIIPKKPVEPEPPISQRIVETFREFFGGE